MSSFFFFFNDTATTEIYTLSLHDALPIYRRDVLPAGGRAGRQKARGHPLQDPAADDRSGNVCAGDGSARPDGCGPARDRKSTRLNSSHQIISYAVFCLKKKNNTTSLHQSS